MFDVILFFANFWQILAKTYKYATKPIYSPPNPVLSVGITTHSYCAKPPVPHHLHILRPVTGVPYS